MFLLEMKLREAKVRVAELGYSEAENTLSQLDEFIDVAKRYSHEQSNMSLSLDDKTILTDKRKDAVMESLNEIIYAEDEQIVKQSAKNVIKQFKRFYDTHDNSTQTHDPLIEGLQRELKARESMIEKLRR